MPDFMEVFWLFFSDFNILGYFYSGLDIKEIKIKPILPSHLKKSD